jgi:uncharacterized metal-binding protein
MRARPCYGYSSTNVDSNGEREAIVFICSRESALTSLSLMLAIQTKQKCRIWHLHTHTHTAADSDNAIKTARLGFSAGRELLPKTFLWRH